MFFMAEGGNKPEIDCVFVLSPGKYVGGAERYIQNLVRVLLETCRTNIIIAVSHNRSFYSECEAAKIPTVYLGDTLRGASLFLSHLLGGSGAKTVISNGYHSLYLVFLARCRRLFYEKRTEFIDVKHGWVTTDFFERFKTRVDKLITFICDCVIVVDPQMRKKLPFVSDKRKLFIPSGVEIKNAEVVHRRRGVHFPFQMLIAGRLSKEKRFELILEALTELERRLWQLTVVGDGSEITHLRRIAIAGAIYDRVRFAGYQVNVDQFYENSDLLIISSINEGCPLIALEAMARGVLVLSTDVGCMPTLLSQRRGFLMGKEVIPHVLARGLSDIMGLNERQKDAIRKRAFIYVRTHHNLKENAKAFERIIKHESNHHPLR